jgi:hypothetical protein
MLRKMISVYLLSCLTLGLIGVTLLAQDIDKASGPAGQAAKGTKAAEEKLISLEKQDWEVWKKKDWSTLGRLLSPDFVWIDDSGVIAGRTNVVKYFSDVDLTGYTMEDVMVTFFNPDVALVTYKATEKGTFKGEQLPSKPFYVGSGYVKRGGKWVNVYTQTTSAR